MNNYEIRIKQNYKNNLFIFMIGALIGSSMLVVSNAEQDTLTTIAEQELNTVISNTESWTISKPKEIIKPVIRNQWTDKQNWQVNYPETQTGMYKYENFVWLNPVMTEIGRYLLEKSNGDIIMVATFIAESWLNPNSKSYTSDYGLCQLNYTYNKKIIDDPRFYTDWKWQADYCVSKRSVAKHTIWVAYSSWAYKKYLYLFK